MTTTSNNYYDLLQISRTASADDIRVAFRKCSLASHPDKIGNSTENCIHFQKIVEAKEMLSDGISRRVYDRMLAEQKSKGSIQPLDLSVLKQNIAEERKIRQQKTPAPKEIRVVVPLTRLYEAAEQFTRGDHDSLSSLTSLESTQLIAVNRVCAQCCGCGIQSTTPLSVPLMRKVCVQCKGSGVCEQMRMLGPGMMQKIIDRCATCNASGLQPLLAAQRCVVCSGSGCCMRQEAVTMTLPLVVNHDHNLSQKQERPAEGDQCVYFINGSVDVLSGALNLQILHEESRPLQPDSAGGWSRVGGNLRSVQSITFWESLLGFEKIIELPHGGKLGVRSEPLRVYVDGDTSVFAGLGLLYQNPDMKRGDLYISWKVTAVPLHLTAEQVVALKVATVTPPLQQQSHDDAVIPLLPDTDNARGKTLERWVSYKQKLQQNSVIAENQEREKQEMHRRETAMPQQQQQQHHYTHFGMPGASPQECRQQ